MCPSFLGIGLNKCDWCDLSLQSNIISFVCASSSFFYNWRWNNSLNFSEIQLFSFHVFSPMLTVFDVLHCEARELFNERSYWSPILHAPFAGPARARVVCLARREWKKLEIFQIHLFFGHGARMLIRHIGRKIDLIPIFFTALVNIVGLLFEPNFFSSLLHVAVGRFLVLHFYGIVCNCIKKWFDLTWLDFRHLSEYASFCRRHVCMDWNLPELLIRVPLWRHEIFPIIGFSGILACSLNVPPIISYWVY